MSGAAAPYLAEYFQKVTARANDAMADPAKLMEIAMNPDAQKKLKDETKAWWDTDGKQLLEKSFKHHDTKGTGVLDKEEANVFFSHMISEEVAMTKAAGAKAVESGIQMSMGMMEGMVPPDQREAMKAQIQGEMAKAIDQLKAEIQKKDDAYKGDKEAKDAAAFKVIDVNGDGTIQLTEFLAAFEPDTDKSEEFQVAIGFLTQQELDQQKAAKEALGGGECTQQ